MIRVESKPTTPRHATSVLCPLFRTGRHKLRTQFGVTAIAGQRSGDVEIRDF
jgi:hypothetical protein